MAIPVEQLAEEMLALPSEARALLADRLVESLDPLTDESIRKAWGREAIRRRDEVRAGIETAVSEEDAALYVRGLLAR